MDVGSVAPASCLPPVMNQQMANALRSSPEVMVEGPRACGKTWTGRRQAGSICLRRRIACRVALAVAAAGVAAVMLAGCSDDQATTAPAPSTTAVHTDPATPTHPDAEPTPTTEPPTTTPPAPEPTSAQPEPETTTSTPPAPEPTSAQPEPETTTSTQPPTITHSEPEPVEGRPCTSPEVVDQTLRALVRDCEALWSFYSVQDAEEHFDSDPATAWAADNPLQNWKGATVTNGRVTDLHLDGLNLHVLEPSLGHLDSLERLVLSNNNLQSAIPAEIGNLTNLRHLDLSHNELSDWIPAEIGALTNLQHLDLSHNQLFGPVVGGLGELANLQHLDLSHNELSFDLPAHLGRLTNLTSLDLSSNDLLWRVPDEWGNLTSLELLDLSDNRLLGPLPPRLADVQTVHFMPHDPFPDPPCTSPDVVDQTLEALVADCQALWNFFRSQETYEPLGFYESNAWGPTNPLTHWHGVGVSNGRVTSLDILPQWSINEARLTPDLADLTALEHLTGCGLEGQIPAELGNLTNLKRLEIYSYSVGSVAYCFNSLTGSIPPELGSLSDLEVLNISDMGPGLTGPIPAELGNLANLKELRLGRNDLTGPIPQRIFGLTNLTTLNLSSNSLTGPIPAEFANLTNLTRLEIGCNSLTGPIPPELLGLTDLSYLDLASNTLFGPIPAWFGDLTNLRYLDLSDNDLTGPIPLGLLGLTNLGVLLLAGNELSDHIPPELGSLTGLWFLDLADNHLAGPIPAELGGLINLGVLDLSGNQLSGPIPDQIADLVPRLWMLRLHDNNLSGPPPAGLAELDYYSVLSLGGNELLGPIPDELLDIPDNTSHIHYREINQMPGHRYSGVSWCPPAERVSQVSDVRRLPWGEGFLQVGYPIVDEDRVDRTRLFSRVSADGLNWSPLERLPIRLPDPQRDHDRSSWPYVRQLSPQAISPTASVIAVSDGERLVLAMLGESTVVAITRDLTVWETFEIPAPSSEGLPDGVTAEPSGIDLAIGPEGWLLLREVQLGVDPWVVAPADIRETARTIRLGNPDYVGGESVEGESQGFEIDWLTEQQEPSDPYLSRFVTWEELGIDEATYREYGWVHYANKPYTPPHLASGEVWVAEWGNEPVRNGLPAVSGVWSKVVGTDAGYFARTYWGGTSAFPPVAGPDYFSADGSTWTRRDTPALNGLPQYTDMSVVTDGIVLDGRLSYPPRSATESESQLWLGDATGTGWRPVELPRLPEGSWFYLRYCRGGAVVKGGAPEDDSSVEWMMASRDGVNWLVVEDPTVEGLGGFVVNGNVMLAFDRQGNPHRFLLP